MAKLPLQLEKSGAVARLTIDRADKRNAFNQEMWELFPHLLGDALGDENIRILLVHASQHDSAFCAGADIGEFSAMAQNPDWRQRNQAAIVRVQDELTRAAKPTIAVIDGDCIGGGCGLALACDMRIAGPKARFGITPAKLGIVYPLHDTKLLIDLVGPAQAKRILYTAELIDAEEARAMGLATKVVDDPYAETDKMVDIMLGLSRHTQEMTKQVVRRILDGQIDDDADTQKLFDQGFVCGDFQERARAFVEKRKPKT